MCWRLPIPPSGSSPPTALRLSFRAKPSRSDSVGSNGQTESDREGFARKESRSAVGGEEPEGGIGKRQHIAEVYSAEALLVGRRRRDGNAEPVPAERIRGNDEGRL